MGAVGKLIASSGLPLSYVEFGTALDEEGNWTKGGDSSHEGYQKALAEFTQKMLDTGAFGAEKLSLEDAMENMDFTYAEKLGYDFDENNDMYPKIPAVGLARWKNGAWEKGYGTDRQVFDNMYGISKYIDSNPSIQLNTNNQLYRGVKSSDEGLQSLRDAFKNGDSISMNGVSSWTSMKPMAEQFTQTSLVSPSGGKVNRVIFIDTTKGQRKAMPYPFSGQAEVLSSGSAKYTITNIEEKDGVHYVTVKQK